QCHRAPARLLATLQQAHSNRIHELLRAPLRPIPRNYAQEENLSSGALGPEFPLPAPSAAAKKRKRHNRRDDNLPQPKCDSTNVWGLARSRCAGEIHRLPQHDGTPDVPKPLVPDSPIPPSARKRSSCGPPEAKDTQSSSLRNSAPFPVAAPHHATPTNAPDLLKSFYISHSPR